MNKVYTQHITEIQYEAEQAFLTEFANGSYTFQNPLVVLNPYKICPLTALILFRTEEATTVRITVNGKYEGTDICHTFPEEKEHILPIYGLYADYSNTVTVALADNTTRDIRIKTAPYAFNEAHRALLSRAEPGFLDNSLMFMSGQLNSRWVGYDRMGEVRWYTTGQFAFALKRLANGNLLAGSSRFVANPYMTTGVMELTMCGKILREYRIPGGYHHDQMELPNHDLLILTQTLGAATKEDMCVQVDRETGNIKRVWDLKNYLPQDKGLAGHASAFDWFHNNSIDYDAKTDSLLFSGRHQSAIISIGFRSNKLNWILGSPEGWPQEMVDKYFFKPVGNIADFEWPSEQHSAIFTPDGCIMCFDNGDFRSKDPEKFLKVRDNYSRGVKYRINTEKMEIEQLWQYGRERGPEFYSGYIGNVGYYGENEYLVHSGGIAFMNGEASEALGSRAGRGPMKNVVKLSSITVVVKDDRIVYECLVPANVYRAVKLDVYNQNETLIPGKGQVLGCLAVTKPAELPGDLPELKNAKALPEEFDLVVKEELDRFDMSGRFHENDIVRFVIADEAGMQCYSLKTQIAPLTMKEGVTVKDDGRSYFWIYLNKEKFRAGGKLYVYVNGELYRTDVTM